MVDVPTIAYIGGRMTHGGIKPQTEMQSDGTYGSIGTRDAMAHRVVPDDPTTGEPSASTLNWYPVFDGTAGDTVYSVDTGGATATTVRVTPDPGWDATGNGEWEGFTLRNNNLTGLGFRNKDIAVVSNTSDTITVAGWTANPEDASGIWFNQGRWRDTHMIGGWRTVGELASVPVRGGATWQLNNFGCSPIPMMVRELWTHVWTSAPFFQLAHYFVENGTETVGGFDDATGSERAAFLVEKARWDAAWTVLANGNTLSWDYIVLDLSQNDVIDWATTPANAASYYGALTQMIAWLRSSAVFNDSTIPVLLVNHDVAINNVLSAGNTAAANTVHDLVALGDANVHTVKLDGLELPLRQTDAAVPTWVPSLNASNYATSVYLRDYPRAVRKKIELLEAGAATDDSGAIPTYILATDSLGVASGFTSDYSDANDDQVYTGGARDPLQMIWNDATQAIETYDAHSNSATAGTISAAAGPEFSLLSKLQERHPVTGALVIKLAAGGSALATELVAHTPGAAGGRWAKSASEQYTKLKEMIQNASRYANLTLGKQINIQAFLVMIGTNDQASADGGAAFATELPAFCGDLRDFGTQVVGKDTPILWVAPHLGTSSSISGEPEAIRTALTARAKADTQFLVVNVDDLKQGADALHLIPSATVKVGERLDESLTTVALPNC